MASAAQPSQPPPAYSNEGYNQGGYQGAQGGYPGAQGGYQDDSKPPEVAYSVPGDEANATPAADAEAGFTARGLDDSNIRRGFIRKVYLILFSQLLVTFGCVLLFSIVDSIKHFALTNLWMFHVSYAVFIVTYIALVCITPLRRKSPGNFIALAVFTLALSFMTGVIASTYSTNIVVVCLGITAVVCLSVTLFAVQTKIDFTMCSGLLFGLSMVVFFFGWACLITYLVYRGRPDFDMTYRIMDCVYGGLLAILFVLFLIFDTQRVVGGRKHDLSEEEYIFGALQLYIDVVYIFLILLGFSRR